MKIRIVDYYYSQSCGCCTESGVKIFVDGEECDQHFCDTGEALAYLLRHMGHEVELENDYYDESYYLTEE